jgi:hypothetical protein
VAPIRTVRLGADLTRYWLGIATLDHVKVGVEGGFCQLGHGKAAPIKRLSAGDWLVYYSPRAALDEGEPVQAFTALGQVARGEPYAVEQRKGFEPTRRNVRYRKRARPALIRPLLEKLELTRGKRNWGMVLRRSLVEISEADFEVIRRAMQAG